MSAVVLALWVIKRSLFSIATHSLSLMWESLWDLRLHKRWQSDDVPYCAKIPRQPRWICCRITSEPHLDYGVAKQHIECLQNKEEHGVILLYSEAWTCKLASEQLSKLSYVVYSVLRHRPPQQHADDGVRAPKPKHRCDARVLSCSPPLAICSAADKSREGSMISSSLTASTRHCLHT